MINDFFSLSQGILPTVPNTRMLMELLQEVFMERLQVGNSANKRAFQHNQANLADNQGNWGNQGSLVNKANKVHGAVTIGYSSTMAAFTILKAITNHLLVSIQPQLLYSWKHHASSEFWTSPAPERLIFRHGSRPWQPLDTHSLKINKTT